MTAVALVIYWPAVRPLVPSEKWRFGQRSYDVALIKNPRTAAEKIVNRAKMEARRHVSYDAAYVSIPYPNGDVPTDRGACTDVIVRALRNAGCDLQRLIYEDKKRNADRYPKYAVNRADYNIDHRRVPNHIAFLRRHGLPLPTDTTGEAARTWKPGDLVYWKLPVNGDHCGVLSNDLNSDGLPLVIHNLGGARQEDCLTSWRIVGHYRYPAEN